MSSIQFVNHASILIDGEEWDIEMTTSSLANVLQFEWGLGTLVINGRFTANYQSVLQFWRRGWFALANNIAKKFPADLEIHELLEIPLFANRLIQQRNQAS